MIDDNRQGLAVRKYILSDLGFEVATAASGEEGVEQFRASLRDAPFSLVLTDYRMPGGMRGDEVVRRLRQMVPGLPVVILSGLTSSLALTPESTGADVVLAKGPREQFDLVETVLGLVGDSRGRARKPPGMEQKSAAGVRRGRRWHAKAG